MPHAGPPVFSLETYADICGAGLGIAGADYAALAAARGVDAATWATGMAQWTKELETAGAESKLSREFMALLTAALERSIGPHKFISLDAYVDISAHGMLGRALDGVLAEHDLDLRKFTLAGYQWKARADADKRLEVYIALRTKKRLAELSHRAERSQFAVIGPGNLLRARHCRNCGALKATKPLTAYVYCDYCATLFDYDVSVEFRDDSALDSDDVDRALAGAIGHELRAAVKAGDREAYARAYEWQVAVATEICPLAFSPRMKDPEYRERFIRDLAVPWQVLNAFEPESRADQQRFAHALETATREPTLAHVRDLYRIARAAWQREVALFEREGLFAKHPDQYDPAMYVYVNASIFVRPWLAVLSDDDQRALLAEAGVAADYVAAPAVEVAPCGCGKCGAQLHVPKGCRRILCEACGHVLEIGVGQFPCRQCGAPLSLPARVTDVVCGACNARWVR